ncbi:hypothetical protein MUA02_17965 [Enterobacteriaceae bacterium H20N1]|uniref:Uncharacterized protein n=1 Tax=Dryocola boscaweniae TaxID=2925397 RepID=A0A9X2WAM8_9ENTR|nr:hypothetical protein [Dryocola boscaweniae]MCT4703742.1 hypothetical protein [Dryocola boscaweniae]MCT4716920.1 hypothetical protein [Dryocola boscaweniae]MCT4720910.1 hypothetical protein [Dryocola boscaweniae]
MSKLDSNEQRRKEGDVSKGLPESAPNVSNAYEEDDRPSKEPGKHGEIPRKRDDSEDDKKGPYRKGS